MITVCQIVDFCASFWLVWVCVPTSAAWNGTQAVFLCALRLKQLCVKRPQCQCRVAVSIPAMTVEGVHAEDVRPLAVLAAIHMKHITDLAWSPDGRYLVATSHDGYCTVVQFEPGELGTPLKTHRHDAMSVRTEIAQRRPPAVCPSSHFSWYWLSRRHPSGVCQVYSSVICSTLTLETHMQKAPRPKKPKDAPAAKPKAVQQTILAAPTKSPIKTLLASASKVRKIQAVAVPDTAAPTPGPASAVAVRDPAAPQPEPASTGVVADPVAPQVPASAALTAGPSGSPATTAMEALPSAGAVPATEAPPDSKPSTPGAPGAKDTCDESMSLGSSDTDASDAPDPASDMDEGDAAASAPAASSIAFLAAQAGQQAAGQGDS